MTPRFENAKSYIAGLFGAVGGGTFYPIVEWLVSYTHAPTNVQAMLTVIITAAISGAATGGATWYVPNKPKPGGAAG
ncbi:MAG TPA: hypothetical protein VJ376_07710 [Pseudomonadota bacterium]|nr:hypothetical protein [Pseudomonadota bacterium]